MKILGRGTEVKAALLLREETSKARKNRMWGWE